MPRRWLITGGTGFVGRRLAGWLIERGEEVLVAARRRESLVPGAQTVPWPDVASPSPVAARFALLVHLAAWTDITTCAARPMDALAVNGGGAGHAVDLASRAGARIVYMSTLGVYGQPRYLPVDEDHPTDPLSAYAASKLAGERITLARATALGVSWAIIRSFNVYGPGQTGDRLVPRILEQARQSNTVRLHDLSSTRDFIYIDDLCEAILRVGISSEQDVFNAGTGVETSAAGMVSLIGDVLGRPLEPVLVSSAAASAITRSQASVARLRDRLGWVPATPLRTGLERTVARAVAARPVAWSVA